MCAVFAVLDRSLVASCKDSIGWMFSKLDTNSDLYLDQAELAAINLDKYEICIRPFFNSCDSYKDGKVSTAEWCLCFWRESKYCVHMSTAGIQTFSCLCAVPLGTCSCSYFCVIGSFCCFKNGHRKALKTLSPINPAYAVLCLKGEQI